MVYNTIGGTSDVFNLIIGWSTVIYILIDETYIGELYMAEKVDGESVIPCPSPTIAKLYNTSEPVDVYVFVLNKPSTCKSASNVGISGVEDKRIKYVGASGILV